MRQTGRTAPPLAVQAATSGPAALKMGGGGAGAQETMVRFFDAKMLQTSCCKECGGEFISHAFDPTRGYVCGLCHMPARAGKTRKAAAALAAAEAVPA